MLQLFAERPFIAAQFSVGDLLCARYDVACRHAEAARDAEEPLWQAYSTALKVVPEARTDRAMSKAMREREAARLAYETARRRSKRAERARDRAWTAYQALTAPRGAT